jgi:glucose/arabinose dehydrogenase
MRYLVALTLVLTACAGDTEPDASRPATSVTTTSPSTIPTVTESTAPSTTSSVPLDDVVTVDPGEVVVGPARFELSAPVDAAVRPGDDRLYVVERSGRVLLVHTDDSAPVKVVLDISTSISTEGEGGLLGLAFSPDGTTAYLNGTTLEDDEFTTFVEAYSVSPDGEFDRDSATRIITIAQPRRNHNGGDLVVDRDGTLLVPTGDGGGANDPDRAALDPTSLLGKLLRIMPLTTGGYEIPEDNPAGPAREVWASGLRNPWRVSLDSRTGDLWIGDVGQSSREEINVAWRDDGFARGASFGWSAYEGTKRFNDDQPVTGHIEPFFEYEHGVDGCSVSAGVRYRGSRTPGLSGAFVFADFCSGRVTALPVLADRTAGRPVVIGEVAAAVAVVEDPEGELWVVSLAGGLHPISAANP